METVSVIGAGSWGTAVARHLVMNGHVVRLWSHNAEAARLINERRENPRYLPGCFLPDGVTAFTDLSQALDGAAAAVLVVPSGNLRDVARDCAAHLAPSTPTAVLTKGIEPSTCMLMTEVAASELQGPSRIACLSGPNHAEEVIKAKPAGTVIASSGQDTAVMFRDLFASPTFRTYTSDDVTGVELCAAFKNVIAIAVGVAYGLGYGDNTAAMLMTRGLAEMSRLTVKCGGQAITCMGLAGAGDLIATCTSEHSRNRSFGVELAQGGTLDGYRERTHMVVEGALACKTLKTLSEAYNVELPITDVVRGVVWEGADPKAAAKDLFARPLTTEFYGL